MILRLKDGARYFLAYDAENRLTSVSGTVSASFVYNGDGQRVIATIGATISTYIGGYFEWQAGTGKSYYFAGAQRIAMRTSAGVEFLLGDHLGSTSLTVDSLGGNPRELRYYPWGEVRWASGTTPTDYRFTDQMEVASIGLYFYNVRWYDSLFYPANAYEQIAQAIALLVMGSNNIQAQTWGDIIWYYTQVYGNNVRWR
jgi:hypothetical protein